MVDCQQTNIQCMFNISDDLLKQKDFTRYLGVLIDDQLGAMQKLWVKQGVCKRGMGLGFFLYKSYKQQRKHIF